MWRGKMTKKHVRATHRSLLDTHLSRVEQRHMSITELREYLDALSIAALVADTNGTYVMANPAAARMLGYKVQELHGMCVWDLIPAVHEHEAEVLWRHFVRVRTQRGTIKLRTKKGDLIAVRYVANAHVLPGYHVSLLSRKS